MGYECKRNLFCDTELSQTNLSSLQKKRDYYVTRLVIEDLKRDYLNDEDVITLTVEDSERNEAEFSVFLDDSRGCR